MGIEWAWHHAPVDYAPFHLWWGRILHDPFYFGVETFCMVDGSENVECLRVGEH